MLRRLGARRIFAGSIDAWAPVLIGWAYDPDVPDQPLELAIFVNDVEIARVLASETRADVIRAGHEVLNCGFSLDLLPHLASSSQVRVVDVASAIEIFTSSPGLRAQLVTPRAASENIGLASLRAEYGSDEELASAVKASGSVVLLSTFRDPQTSDLPVRHLIGALKEQGIAVVAVDTSPDEPGETFGADKLLWRTNVGWDFASWFTAIERQRTQIDGAERLYLVNDSCVGPFGGLGTILNRGWSSGSDVWSLTDSWEHGYHMQSYFMAFGPNALRSGVLTAFAEQYEYPVVKRDIVHKGEVALTRFLRAEGCSVGAVFPFADLVTKFLDDFEDELAQRMAERQVLAVRALDPAFIPPDVEGIIKTFEKIRAGRPLNATHSFWRQLLNDGFPFLKRELVVRDPATVCDLGGVGKWIGANATDAERAVVLADLGQRDLHRTVIFD